MSEQDGDGYGAAKYVPTFWRVVRPKAARSLSDCIGTKKLRPRSGSGSWWLLRRSVTLPTISRRLNKRLPRATACDRRPIAWQFTDAGVALSGRFETRGSLVLFS